MIRGARDAGWVGAGAAVAAGAVLGGCGGAPRHRAGVCRPGAAVLVRAAARMPVRAAAGTGGNAQPQCVLRAGAIRATVNLDSSPQPYQRLERAIVELGQQFGAVREVAPPQSIAHLGLDAAWIPSTSQVITSDGRRLITVGVDWPHAPASRSRALGIALARAYL